MIKKKDSKSISIISKANSNISRKAYSYNGNKLEKMFQYGGLDCSTCIDYYGNKVTQNPEWINERTGKA